MDYYTEFYDVSDRVFCEFVKKQTHRYPSLLEYKSTPINDLIIFELYMYGLFSGWKTKYNGHRLNSSTVSQLEEMFLDELNTKFAWDGSNQNPQDFSDKNNEWEELLRPYENQLMIYLFNERQLNYLMPLIQNMRSPTVILSDFEVPDSFEASEHISIIEIGFSTIFTYKNDYLYTKFPLIYHYLNTFEQIISNIKPSGILFLEGCHLPEKTLNVVAHSYNVKTACIQQGWPSFMHTLFKRYIYDYFFTWGDLFNRLWENHNPVPVYVECGYMYEVKTNLDKQSITFFLQAPVFLSDPIYFEELLSLIKETAEKHPRIPVQVREHPEHSINDLWRKSLEALENVKFVGDIPIADVYANTLIAVSHFSSCIMESIIHNCIPFVFNPTNDSRYYPDIDAMGVGLISKEKDDFLNKIETLLLNKEMRMSYFSHMSKQKRTICTNISSDAIKEIISQINRLLITA